LVHPQRDEAGGRVQFPVAEPGGRQVIWQLDLRQGRGEWRSRRACGQNATGRLRAIWREEEEEVDAARSWERPTPRTTRKGGADELLSTGFAGLDEKTVMGSE